MAESVICSLCLCVCIVCAYMPRDDEMAKKAGVHVFPVRRCGQGQCLSVCLHVEPVITHAGSVPLTAAVPAPLQSALRLWTLHVHTSSCGYKGYRCCGLVANTGSPCPHAIPEMTLVAKNPQQGGQRDSEPGGIIRNNRRQHPPPPSEKR